MYKNKGSVYKLKIQIGLQSQIAKIFEASYSVRLTDNFDKIKITHTTQNGFCKKDLLTSHDCNVCVYSLK